MKTRHSTAWRTSTQPRKQRKYRHNAPLHLQGTFLSANLVKDLRDKYGKRTLRVRSGDKIRVMRGRFKGQEGKVERVDVKAGEVFATKIEIVKKDGATKVPYGLNPSNVMIVELDTSDKKRMTKLKENAK